MPGSDSNNPLEKFLNPRPTTGRRDFFGDALREALAPLSDLIEQKVDPILRAIDQLPGELDAMVGPITLDQPQVDGVAGGARKLSLPLATEQLLRPPGALPEGEFESVCSKCAKCVQVCPANAIKIDVNGMIGDGLPYIVPADRPCVLCDELACMKECPSGALKLVDKCQIRMGTAKVDQTTCLRSRGEDCRSCVTACPLGDRAIYVSEQTHKVRVRKSGCVGCGICENICPTEPRSIVVRSGRGGDGVIVA